MITDYAYHVFLQLLSVSRHTLNVDITSPTFTDVNFRYAARRDGVSASISTPSTGFLGLQLQGRIPSQLSARLYSRYAVSVFHILKYLLCAYLHVRYVTLLLKYFEIVIYSYVSPISNSLPQRMMLTSWSSELLPRTPVI